MMQGWRIGRGCRKFVGTILRIFSRTDFMMAQWQKKEPHIFIPHVQDLNSIFAQAYLCLIRVITLKFKWTWFYWYVRAWSTFSYWENLRILSFKFRKIVFRDFSFFFLEDGRLEQLINLLILKDSNDSFKCLILV